MATYQTGSDSEAQLSGPPTWVRILLGIVLIVTGLFVLGDVALAAVVSTMFIGAMAVIAGGFEIIHAFWTRGWGGLGWQLLLGALYVAVGIVLLSQPVAGALILTYVLGLLLLMSGILRIAIGFSHWRDLGWVMLLSGAFGVIAGLMILAGFPKTTFWVLGLVLGIDLIAHGLAWFTYGWLPSARTA